MQEEQLSVRHPLRDDSLEFPDHAANKLREFDHGWDDAVTGERLTLREHYLKGAAKIVMVFEGSEIGLPCQDVLVFSTDAAKSVIRGENVGRTGIEVPHVEVFEGGHRCNDRNHFMLVGDTESMKGEQVSLPSVVRLALADYFDNLWSGEIYLSIVNGRYKTLFFRGERKLDPVRVLGTMRGNEVPNDDVECRSEVMNNVPYYNSEHFGNGLVRFQENGALSGLGLVSDGNSPTLLEKFGRGPVQVVDVLFGPL